VQSTNGYRLAVPHNCPLCECRPGVFQVTNMYQSLDLPWHACGNRGNVCLLEKPATSSTAEDTGSYSQSNYLNSASGCIPSGISNAAVYADWPTCWPQTFAIAGNTVLPAYSTLLFGTGHGTDVFSSFSLPA
jgi:hypothetical protein